MLGSSSGFNVASQWDAPQLESRLRLLFWLETCGVCMFYSWFVLSFKDWVQFQFSVVVAPTLKVLKASVTIKMGKIDPPVDNSFFYYSVGEFLQSCSLSLVVGENLIDK